MEMKTEKCDECGTDVEVPVNFSDVVICERCTQALQEDGLEDEEVEVEKDDIEIEEDEKD